MRNLNENSKEGDSDRKALELELEENMKSLSPETQEVVGRMNRITLATPAVLRHGWRSPHKSSSSFTTPATSPVPETPPVSPPTFVSSSSIRRPHQIESARATSKSSRSSISYHLPCDFANRASLGDDRRRSRRRGPSISC